MIPVTSLCKLFIFTNILTLSLQQIARRKLSPSQMEGRVSEMDELIERHISTINVDKPVPRSMNSIIAEAQKLAKIAQDPEMGDYYVKILKSIRDEGINFINDERDRLHTILESTSGGEYEYAHYQKNVIEGMVDAAAEDVMNRMRDFAPDLKMFKDISLDDHYEHDEV